MTEGLQKADKTLGFYKSGKEVLRSTAMWLWWRAAQSHGSQAQGKEGRSFSQPGPPWPHSKTDRMRTNMNR